MNTLYKKNCNTGQSEVFYPMTTLDKVIDANTNESLDNILQQYNHIWLPFKGNSKTLTRQLVPSELRRRGLWITYQSCKNNTITEWYNSDNFRDAEWGKNDNWVQIVDKDTVSKIAKELVEWYKFSDKNEVHGNVKDLFHWYGSTAAFITHKNQGLIPFDSIAFLHTGQIYVQGQLIGVSSEDYKQLEKSVKKVLDLFSQEDTEGTIGSINSIVEFLEGFQEGQTLKKILDNKVDKEVGKGLSTNDFTNELKKKLEELNPLTTEEIEEIISK